LLHIGLRFYLIESFYLFAIYFPHFIFIANSTPKIPKLLLYYYRFLVDSANQYLQLLVGSTTFLI
jgi:hypothetical protein